MTDKTLPERIREAADVIVVTCRRRYPGPDIRVETVSVSPRMLRGWADYFEREDAEKAAAEAALDAEVEDLAKALHHQVFGVQPWEYAGHAVAAMYRDRARDLIAAGWRKQATT